MDKRLRGTNLTVSEPLPHSAVKPLNQRAQRAARRAPKLERAEPLLKLNVRHLSASLVSGGRTSANHP